MAEDSTAMPHVPGKSPGDKILIERISLLYRSLPIIVIVNILAGVLLAYTLWEISSHHSLMIWLLLIVMVSVIRLIGFLSYQRKNKPELATRYGSYFILGSGLAGFLLGIASVIFFPTQSIEHQFFILVLFAGMGVAAMSSLHTYLPALYTYLLTLLTPAAIKMLSIGDSIHISLGIMVFAWRISASP